LQIFKKIKGKTPRGYDYSPGTVDIIEGIRLYALIRRLKPGILVETGVCNGFSTAFILSGLNKNKRGKLYSVDFPEKENKKYENGIFWEGKGGAIIPSGKQSGWLVPERLKKRWILIIGKSQEKLPSLLKKLNSIDLFMHDSEHSYECMWFEFNEVYKFLKKGGVLLSHDINCNNAFYDFFTKYKKNHVNISENLGLIIK
jgi:predicted O-methyltransferase YrrM